MNFQKVVDYYKGINNVLSCDGIEIFQNIENKYFEMLKTNNNAPSFNFKNHPYNFTYSEFIKLNKLKNDQIYSFYRFFPIITMSIANKYY